MRQIILLLALTALTADSSWAQRLNRTIELLAADKPVFGVFGWNQSVDNAIALARSDLDFVINYYERADTWPLDPEGEILVVFQIETREGVGDIGLTARTTENLARAREKSGR